MKRFSLYRLLDSPLIYKFVEILFAFGSKRLLKHQYKNIYNESIGMVLDVGCGPALTSPLPHGAIIGVDTNIGYVKNYARAMIRRTTCNIKNEVSNEVVRSWGVVGSADEMPLLNNIFDEVRSVGLIHHLQCECAKAAIIEMVRCTKINGRIFVFDSVWPIMPFYRPLAWLLRKLDRGKWVRTENELLKLANSAYPMKWQSKRFTYSYTGLEGLFLTVQKTEIPMQV